MTAARAPALEGVLGVGAEPRSLVAHLDAQPVVAVAHAQRDGTGAVAECVVEQHVEDLPDHTLVRHSTQRARLEVETQRPSLECEPWTPFGLDLVCERNQVRLRI